MTLTAAGKPAVPDVEEDGPAAPRVRRGRRSLPGPDGTRGPSTRQPVHPHQVRGQGDGGDDVGDDDDDGDDDVGDDGDDDVW